MYIVVFDGVSFLIITLFSSGMTLLVSYSGGGGYDGPPVVLNIKPGVYSLGDCGSNAYSLFVWFIAVSLLS